MVSNNAEDALSIRLEASLGQLERTMQRALGVVRSSTDGMQASADRMRAGMQRNANVAAQALTDAQQRIGRATGVISGDFRSAAASASTFETALNMRDGVNRLQASMDPLHAATLRYRSAVAQVEAAVESGAIEQAQANTVLRLAKVQYDATTASLRGMQTAQVSASAGVGRFLNLTGGGRFVLQNTAAQIGDMAVQLEAGTSASRVMAQQLPQLLGGFGALGGALGVIAPLLGTVAAIGIPVAAALWAMGGNADDTATSVETFADKLENATQALNRARDAAQMAGVGGLDQLRDRYGQVTTSIVELSQALADIERRAARTSINTALTDTTFVDGLRQQIDSVFGTVGSAVTGAFDGEIEAMRQGIRDLEAEIAVITQNGGVAPTGMINDLTLMREELAAAEGRMADLGSLASEIRLDPALLSDIAQMQADLAAAVQAGDMSAIADAAKGLREALQATGQEIEQGVLDNLTRVEDLARQSAGALDDGATAASGLGGELSAAAGDASDMTARLREAASVLAGMVSATASLGVSNIGDRARVAALERGQSQVRANAEARIAEERARIGQALGSSDAIVRGQAQRELEQFTAAINEQAALAERLTTLTESSRPAPGGRRGASGDSAALGESEIAALQHRIDLIGRTDAEVAQLEARYQLLNTARQRGLDLDSIAQGSNETIREQIERQAESIGQLTEQYAQASERARFFESAQSDLQSGILDAIVDGKDLSGVLQDLARSFARAALQASLFGDGPLAGLFGGGKGGGGLLGGLLGGLFGRASGGPVRAGGVYMVGENGPEPFIAPANGRIVSNGALQRMSQSGASSAAAPTISIAIDARGAQQGVAQEIATALNQRTPEIVRKAVEATQAALTRGYL